MSDHTEVTTVAGSSAASPTKPLGEVIQIDQAVVQQHLGEVVRSTVEEMLDAEADRLCGARRYEHNPDRVDTRAGHYERSLHTKAGAVAHKMPKLRSLSFEIPSSSASDLGKRAACFTRVEGLLGRVYRQIRIKSGKYLRQKMVVI